ncbi:hypothetical protein ACFQ1I_02840 [Kitasatospora arboriphila]
MTEQRTNGASPVDAASTYLAQLGERLRADGTQVTAAGWCDHSVVVGSRGDRKLQWFGTKTELFVLAAVVPEIDSTALVEFTGWAMDRAKHIRSGLPGARNAATVLPTLISSKVQPSAAQWAAADARLLGTTLIGLADRGGGDGIRGRPGRHVPGRHGVGRAVHAARPGEGRALLPVSVPPVSVLPGSESVRGSRRRR